MAETVTGILERVVFFNAETDYFVGELAVGEAKEAVIAQGKMASPLCGETLELTGTWTMSKYGRQFKFDRYRQLLPSSVYGIKRFLASGIVKGIGEKLADKIVDHFGTDIFRILDEESGRLREIKGLGEDRAKALKTAWVDHQKLREAHIYLHSLGLSTNQCERLVKRFGSSVKRIIEQTPYELLGQLDRIGFKTVDQIAKNAGVPAHSPERLKAGLEFAFSEAEDDGHTALTRQMLIEEASKLLEVEADRLEHPLIELIEKDLIEPIGDGSLLQLPRMAAHEKAIAKHLDRLASGPSALPAIDFEKAIVWAQERSKLSLTDEQIRSVHQALKQKVSILTGGPGTGKTTVLKTLIEVLRAKGVLYNLASPTGRAAQRMTEATGASAQTLHRLLKFDPTEFTWTHDEQNPLETEFVIIDETSMIDTPLMSALVKALPSHAHLVLVGDADQLPSVGPGEILHDLINSKHFPVTRLKRIFRQNEGLLLATAHSLISGEVMPPPYKKRVEDFDDQVDMNAFAASTPEETVAMVVELCQKIIPEKLGLNPIRDVQVLVPMHKGVVGTQSLNEALQKALNADRPGMTIGNTRYTIGDKLLQTRNNYDKMLFNGDIGRVESFEAIKGELTAAFTSERVQLGRSELMDTALAYAISIHKSQGSEYPCVVVPLVRGHYTMLTRNLLYTAITRGKRHVVLVGDPSAYKIAASRLQTNTRTTALRIYLDAQYAPKGL